MKKNYLYEPSETVGNFDVQNVKFSKKYPMLDQIFENEKNAFEIKHVQKNKGASINLPEIDSAL